MLHRKLHIKNMHEKTSQKLKYFLNQKRYKFVEHCWYKHIITSNINEISELKEKVAVLEGSIELLKAKIIEVAEEVAHIKRYVAKKENEIIHECSQCAYLASTCAVLKLHVTMKHKSSHHAEKISSQECGQRVTSYIELKKHSIASHTPQTPSTEIEKHHSINDSLVLSLEKEDRSEDCSSYSRSHF